MRWRTGLGRDSHRFAPEGSSKPCIVAGVLFESEVGLTSHSDGDVVYHAICNAITSLTHVPILGAIALDLCTKRGITDSEVYVREACKTLRDQTIEYVAISIEGRRPLFKAKFTQMRANIANALSIDADLVGITAITGEGLTDFGCGDGLQVVCLITTAQR